MTNKELPVLMSLTASFPCSGLTIDKIKKVLQIHNNVKSKAEEYSELRQKIWTSYGITTDEEYAAHKDIEKITDEVTALDNEEVDISPSNFLSEDEVLRSIENTKGITTVGVTMLLDLLMIK